MKERLPHLSALIGSNRQNQEDPSRAQKEASLERLTSLKKSLSTKRTTCSQVAEYDYDYSSLLRELDQTYRIAQAIKIIRKDQGINNEKNGKSILVIGIIEWVRGLVEPAIEDLRLRQVELLALLDVIKGGFKKITHH